MSQNNVKKAASAIIGPYDFQERAFHDRASLCDYAKLVALFASLPGSAVGVILYRQYKWLCGSPQNIALKDSLLQAAIDSFADKLTWRQLRIIAPIRPLRIELDIMKCFSLSGYNNYFGGTKYSARWLCEVEDRGMTDPVILYLHGGSYAMKTQRPQISYMASLARMWAQYRVSVLILDYTVGPFAKFPTQLEEAMACYEELSQSCNQILAFGDSCGGHLALDMLMSGAKFNLGCALVSPSTDMTSGAAEDLRMREIFVDPKSNKYDDHLISPLYADPSIWPKILPQNTAVVWGGAEVCKAQMVEWANLAKVKAAFEEPYGGHDCILRGTKNQGSVFIQRQIEGWLRSLMGVRSHFLLQSSSSRLSEGTRRSSSLPLEMPFKEKKKWLQQRCHADKTVRLLTESKTSGSDGFSSESEQAIKDDVFDVPRTIS